MKKTFTLILLLLLMGQGKTFGQDKANDEVDIFESLDEEGIEDVSELDVDEDFRSLFEDESKAPLPQDSKASVLRGEEEGLEFSDKEELDDLEALKEDIGSYSINETQKKEKEKMAEKVVPKETPNKKVVNQAKSKIEINAPTQPVGLEEQELLELSKKVAGKIPDSEWNDIATMSKVGQYTVRQDEWLWKISEKLFGSGFYYSKIWALNPYIKNPHEIEPGMTLVFTSGDELNIPQVRVGSFDDESTPATQAEVANKKEGKKDSQGLGYYDQFGDEIIPPWIKEKERLQRQGVYVQYATDTTYEDIVKLSNKALKKDYEIYEPPAQNFLITEPDEAVYDETGFDKNSVINFDFKEGFYLNSFVTSNIVQDLGHIDSAAISNKSFIKGDTIYVRFDSATKVTPGDKYSVYKMEGRISHRLSDRVGRRYTIVGQIEISKSKGSIWEAKVLQVTGLVQRNDRLTIYTPKINKINKTFNARTIEAALVSSYEPRTQLHFGDVVYLDRGRADGVELGNVFETYGYTDRNTGKVISRNPTYKTGEITVITLSDDFSTGLVTQSNFEMKTGTIALSKTIEQAARHAELHDKSMKKEVEAMEAASLNKLDVELNLNDLTDDLLDKVDAVELSDEEMEELERQEQAKSFMTNDEKDLAELEELEKEIEAAENNLNAAKKDEDQYLETQDLNDLESEIAQPDPNALESVNELEQELGLKYLDENPNNKENPYGLTENDLEEVDDLLDSLIDE